MPREEKIFYFPVRLSEELDRLFEEIIHRPWGFARELGEWNPSVDLYEIREAFVLEVDLPGVRGEDVKVKLEGSDLILEGKRSLSQVYNDGRFHCQERSFGRFLRRFYLPESVDKEKIRSEFTDGVLRVILPKIRNRRRSGE